jgi:DNA-directed RNA polymerase subunit L
MTFQEKNGSNNNEMTDYQMASVENLKTSNRGFELSCEFVNFPISFVNALRRILLASIPTVAIQNVEILVNTTQLPHEMLKHRVEMLPINVLPSDSATIKDAKVELRVLPSQDEKTRTITTSDFVVQSGREELLMKDRDIGEPMLFLRVRKGEEVHLKATLGVLTDTKHVGQLCNVSSWWKIDPEKAKAVRKEYVDAGNDVREFDNFLVQKCFHTNEKGEPYWICLAIESIGVMSAKDALRISVDVLRKKVNDYVKEAVENIRREQDKTFSVITKTGGHTIGGLFQQVIYSDLNTSYVSYDIVHPLKPDLKLQFCSDKSPESVLKMAKDTIEEYCNVLEKVL